MFGFHIYKFWNFRGVKIKYSQILGSKIQTTLKFKEKIQILKRECIKSKHPKISDGKIQILKFQGIKFKYPQTLGV